MGKNTEFTLILSYSILPVTRWPKAMGTITVHSGQSPRAQSRMEKGRQQGLGGQRINLPPATGMKTSPTPQQTGRYLHSHLHF